MSALSAPQRKRLASLRRLLRSTDRDVVGQAIDLLISLADPDLWAVVAAGVSVEPSWGGCVELKLAPGEITRRVKSSHRDTVALAAARHTGLLDGVRALRIFRLNLLDLSALVGLPRLEELSISVCVGLTDLRGLSSLPSLSVLEVGTCIALRSLTGLSNLPTLSTIAIRHCRSLENYDALSGLPAMKTLTISRCPMVDLQSLSGTQTLETLTICSPALTTAAGLNTTALRNLDLGQCHALTTLTALRGAERLQHLKLAHCPTISSLDSLARLPALRTLDLTHCTGLSDLRALEDLPVLRKIDAYGCPELQDAVLPGVSIER